MTTTRRWTILAALTISTTIGIACDDDKAKSPGAPNDKTGGKRKVVAVVPKGTTHVFWQSVKHGAEKAGKELDVDIKWDGPPNEKELSTQIRIVGDMQTRGVDALAIAPLSKDAIDATIAQAARKIPVVIFDSGSGFKDYKAFVATDNKKGGRLAGQEMLRLLGDKPAEVAVIRYGAESKSTLEREEGFLEEVKRNPRLTIYDKQFGGSKDESIALTSNLLQAHPNITAVFASNESTAVGALGALRRAGKLKQVTFIGFDSSSELAAGLDAGEIQALVLQDPVQMGYRAVKAAVAALRGQSVEKEQPIEPVLVTPANKDTEDVRRLLRPKFD